MLTLTRLVTFCLGLLAPLMIPDNNAEDFLPEHYVHTEEE